MNKSDLISWHDQLWIVVKIEHNNDPGTDYGTLVRIERLSSDQTPSYLTDTDTTGRNIKDAKPIVLKKLLPHRDTEKAKAIFAWLIIIALAIAFGLIVT
jgi:hypothetical protein